MAKILTDKEVVSIIQRTVEGDLIDDRDQHLIFLADLANVVARHFGGDVGSVDYVPDVVEMRPLDANDKPDGYYTVAFHHNESVPEDGGVFALYDTDEKWDRDEGAIEEKD